MMVDEEYLNLFNALDKFTKLPTKVCTKCKKNKLITEYYKKGDRRYSPLRRKAECKTCVRESQQKYKKEKPFNMRHSRIKNRARINKLPFNITVEYLESIWTDACPILGLKLDLLATKHADNAAQLDRIVPDKGYVKGNVSWLSARANRLKDDATAKEHMKIAQWMLGQLNDG